MNKSALVASISEKVDSKSKAEVERFLNATIAVVTETLAAGDDVSLIGFGVFSAKDRAARMGRNPKTGEAIKIKASRVPVFKAGSVLKKAVQK